MTAIDIQKARNTTRRASETVEQNRETIERARRQEATLDHALAKSDIATAHYRNVLKRAGVLK
jgi:hypothetical protein